jgi:hypothetical protein
MPVEEVRRSLTVEAFGPFLKGVVDGANPSLDNKSTLRSARHVTLSGKGRLMAGPGSSVAITLMDDQGSPAACTSVVLVKDFSDGALAIGHSTVTSKVYLYRLDSEFTGYYDIAGAFHASATATPVGVLWTASATPPVCTIAELLNVAFIARTDAATAVAQTFPMQRFDLTTLAALTADLDGTGAKNVYALGTFSFHGHLWIWGFDKGNVAATAYRPELLRFGGPDGGLLTDDGKGTFTVGHRVRSAREAIVGGCVAGEVAYIGTTYSLWPVVGYGRDSWDKSKPLDESFGFIGIQAAVNAGGVLYYWSPRGPARCEFPNKPEPLWGALPVMIPSIVDPEKIVAAYDADRDQVLWYYKAGVTSGNQLLVAYDVERECFVGPDTDQGILVGCASLVGKVQAAAAASSPGPAGPPTTPSTTAIGSTAATANWANGDTAPETTTLIEYRVQGTTPWTSAGSASSGVTSLTITGLSGATAYEWRASHLRNAQQSAFLGPVAGSQFTTSSLGTLLPPTGASGQYIVPKTVVKALWTNSGESGVSTEVWYAYGAGAPGAFSLLATAGVGASSFASTLGAPPPGQDTWFQMRHVKSGYTPSTFTTAAKCV